MMSLFAVQHTFHIGSGLGVRINRSYVSYGESGYYRYEPGVHITPVYFDYSLITDGGFSFKVSNSLGSEIDDILMLGIGYSPIVNDRVTLSLFGDINLGPQIGTDIMFTYRFNNVFGLFVDVGTFWPVTDRASTHPFLGKIGVSFTIPRHND